ncbi:nitric oxide synthase-interacting protein [Thraustotheca clavata]|uniref:Nitric oxide synthase-interacting protein n=1 Tax=Thraustotheca clavata TaxID=74557 RepID=A0A1V9ZX52_9STRA|nr:nitric oxide synthase-interacting protein [Thraustotheca clavata]
MSRHSKNSTATHHFTYHEKQAAGHGTLKRRFGKDAQLAFGSCSLCLKPILEKMEPLASPSGFLYCKGCIYANLLTQKQQIKQNLEAYKAQEEEKMAKEDVEKLNAERAKLETSLTGATPVPFKKSAEERAILQLKSKVDLETIEEKSHELKRTSFWVPGFTPTAEVKMAKPDELTRDPMSNKPMKLKHLMPVQLKRSEKETKGESFVMCAVSNKAITHQLPVLLRPSGQVIMESCLKEMVLPTMTCPISGLKLRTKDIIHLQAGGTSYSAHSQVEAKKYRPSMT